MKVNKKSVKDFSKWIYAVCMENDITVYAGHATLMIITASFPFLMLVLNAINWFALDNVDIMEVIFRVIPDMEMIRTSVEGLVDNLREQSSGYVASFAALFLLWFASGGITAIQAGLKKITFDSSKTTMDPVISMVFTILFIILIPSLFVFQVMGNSFVQYFHLPESIINLINWSGIIMLVVSIFILTMTYTYLPGGRRKIRYQIPGAVFTTVVWYVFSKLFAYFIPRFWKTSALYGSLAALVLVIMWLRIIMTVLFVGQALNTLILVESYEKW